MYYHSSFVSRTVAVLSFALLLEPVRYGVPTLNVVAAQFPPTIVITEGKTGDGFPYMFGGVGSDEREAMLERVKDYNVKLVFAEKRGAFISGVMVMIATSKGVEIDTLTTAGPWFYIQLPPGEYAVKATFKGQTKESKNLRVEKGKSVQRGFIWDLGEE